MWPGIHAVPAGHYPAFDEAGAQTVRWCRLPAPQTAPSQGAVAVRDALTASLSHRAPAQGRLSSDLSGGMDSTSLCFLPTRTTPNLLTFRRGEAEAGNDDAFFAAHAINAPADTEHLVLGPQEGPVIYDDADVATGPEEPYRLPRTAARNRYTARLLTEQGSRQHLAGHSGDELFTPVSGYLHPLVRRHPVTATAWRHMHGHTALRRRPLWSTLGRLPRAGTVAT